MKYIMYGAIPGAIVGLTFAWFLSGCMGQVEPTQVQEQAQCVPNTSCGQSTCGVLPDGCGGTFSCGQCNPMGTATTKGTQCYFPVGVTSSVLLAVSHTCHGGFPPDVDAIAKDDPRCAQLVHACE
jgi:hypothetical protein